MTEQIAEAKPSKINPASPGSAIDRTFERVKDGGKAAREGGVEFIAERLGPDAAADLQARLVAYDAARAEPPVRRVKEEPAPAAEAGLAERLTAAIARQAEPQTEPASPPISPAPEAEPEPIAEPGPHRPGAIVDTGAPYEVARRFLLDTYSTRIGGSRIPTLRWWCGEWRKWSGAHYAEMEFEGLRAELYEFLARVNHGKFDPAQKHINEVVDAIKALAFLSNEVEVGTWLGEGEPPWGAGAVVTCKNGVLRLNDGRLWPHDPRLFALNVIEAEYDPHAEAPRWSRFLDELWGGDDDTRNALQEFFGLVLTDETKFQKGFIVVGPARSGKGTIARMLMHLLGRSNYCGPSLNQLTGRFGMQHFPGKKLAVIPDARLDNRANRSVITEKLLSIIGEDVQDIDRKNKSFWSGILRLRIMILSNELPDFKDDTGVIATRFVILQTLVSFLGREDTDLEGTLCGELSGILNWALAGWHRLVERGKFKPPGNGELNEELSSNASAIKAFVAECCELAPDATATIDAVYSAYRGWCEGRGGGWSDRLPINQFSGKLRSAFHGQVDVIRPRDGGTRKRAFLGLRLRRGQCWSA